MRPGDRVLLVGGGGPAGHVMDWSRSLIQEAITRGLSVVVADLPENLASVPAQPTVSCVVADWHRPEEIVQLAGRLNAESATTVVGFREYSLRSTALAAAQCDQRWNPVQAIDLTRDKWSCRREVTRLGFGQPLSAICRNEAEVYAAVTQAGYPAILKPRSAYGSQGVSLVRTAVEIAPAIAAVHSFGSEVLVEEYVRGDEISIEGVFTAGRPVVLAIHRKRIADTDNFVETGHRTADDLDAATVCQIQDIMTTLLPGLGLRASLFHVEAWLTGSGIVLGEVHSRTGGDWIHRLVQESTGASPFGLVLDDLMGDSSTIDAIIPFPRPDSGASVSALSCMPGRVQRILNCAEVCVADELIALDLAVAHGDVIAQQGDSGARAGLIVARSPAGTNPGHHGAAAATVADRLADRVRIETTPL